MDAPLQKMYTLLMVVWHIKLIVQVNLLIGMVVTLKPVIYVKKKDTKF